MRLKYDYSVISVIVESLPGNTKNWQSTRSWLIGVRWLDCSRNCSRSYSRVWSTGYLTWSRGCSKGCSRNYSRPYSKTCSRGRSTVCSRGWWRGCSRNCSRDWPHVANGDLNSSRWSRVWITSTHLYTHRPIRTRENVYIKYQNDIRGFVSVCWCVPSDTWEWKYGEGVRLCVLWILDTTQQGKSGE